MVSMTALQRRVCLLRVGGGPPLLRVFGHKRPKPHHKAKLIDAAPPRGFGNVIIGMP
jgi:hypothetical protein